MEHSTEEQKVVELLAKLKNSNGAYPSEMLAARRQTYLRQMANIGLGLGLGAGLGSSAKGGGGSAGVTTTITSKILETALIAAIVIEAGTVAYLYREKIADAVQSLAGAPRAQEVASPASDESSGSDPAIEAVGTPLVSSTETPSGTPSGTPSSEVAGENNNGNNDSSNSGVSANATPNPGENQGNQYGLTPKPERTKENNSGDNNNTGGSGGGGNNNDGGGDNNNGNGGGNK